MDILKLLATLVSLTMGVVSVVMGIWFIRLWPRAKHTQLIVFLKPKLFLVVGILFVGAGIGHSIEALGHSFGTSWVFIGRWLFGILFPAGLASFAALPFLLGWARLSTETPIMRSWEIAWGFCWLILSVYMATALVSSVEFSVVWVFLLIGIASLIRQQAIQQARKAFLTDKSIDRKGSL